MEVHQHTHSERNKFKDYLCEFLMLFLAVTLGFFVENQRDHYVEHQRAKEYAKLLIDDLQIDITELNRAEQILNRIIVAGDSLAIFLDNPDIKKVPGGKLYYYEYWSGWRWNVISRDATIQQLKNSGSLRYMKSTIVKKILDYEESIKLIYLLQEKYEPEKIQNWNLVQKIFDQNYFRQLSRIKAAARDSSLEYFNLSNRELQTFVTLNIPLGTYDKNMLFEIKNWALNSSWSYQVQIGNLQTAIKKAVIAIEALKNEYHIN